MSLSKIHIQIIGGFLVAIAYGFWLVWLAVSSGPADPLGLDLRNFATIFYFMYTALVGIAFLLLKNLAGLAKGFLLGSLFALVMQGLWFTLSMLSDLFLLS